MAPSASFRGRFSEITFLVPTFLVSFALFAVLLSTKSTDTTALLQTPAPVATEQHKLQLTTSNVFTLVIFSDLHFGEEEHGWGIDQDINSTRVMNAVLDAEEAIDLVVLNGDLITGENTFQENSSDYVSQIVAPMRDRAIPWASTYGNHDSKFNLSREAIFRAEKEFPLSYTQRMDTSLPGVTNYYLIVQSSDGGPVAVLWFFDSRGGASYQHDPSDQDDIPNWVADETAQWFTETSQEIRSQHGPLPGIAFVHIPPHPYLAVQQDGLDPARFPGINDDVPVSIQGGGHDDDAFVKALQQDNLLHSVYVGHDHGSSWCGIWPSRLAKKLVQRKLHGDDDDDDEEEEEEEDDDDDEEDDDDDDGDDDEHNEDSSGHRKGPFLCFARHTGYGGYGDWDRGARVVQLSFQDLNDDGTFADEGEMSVETWVRMESGEVITRVMLNETYGNDIYT